MRDNKAIFFSLKKKDYWNRNIYVWESRSLVSFSLETRLYDMKCFSGYSTSQRDLKLTAQNKEKVKGRISSQMYAENMVQISDNTRLNWIKNPDW